MREYPLKVLLIDQDTSTLERVQNSLTRAGYQVLIAADSNAGLRLAREEKPNLIILDILLTNLDGVELTQKLKQHEETRQTPIFLISSLNVPKNNEPWQPTPQSKWQLLRYKAYLPKPVDISQLVRKVDALLKPEIVSNKPSGPRVFVVHSQVTDLTDVSEALIAADFDVKTYSEIDEALTAIYSHLPTILVIETQFLDDEKVLRQILSFQERHPTFSLLAIDTTLNKMPPAYLDHVDHFIGVPIQPWQVVRAVQKSVGHRSLETRVDMLSKQVLNLNWELIDSKQTLQYQNQELDWVNRQLHRLSELKETFTGMLVHDLKAPLSAIMGALQFMGIDPENTLSETSKRILSGGMAAGQQMTRMTHTLLDEHKLENNQLAFDIEPTNLNEIFETGLEMLSPLLSMQKIEVKKIVDVDLPPLRSDPLILQRIIENLLDNAIKYSPPNEAITIQATREDNFAKICIADRGEGIPKEFRELIFDRFTQLQDPKAEKLRGGVGLGLAFCKLAIAAMGGTIWVDSLNGVGTAFYFTIPLDNEDEDNN